jgi:hypothetical protein
MPKYLLPGARRGPLTRPLAEPGKSMLRRTRQ